jgi:hypothetical protein
MLFKVTGTHYIVPPPISIPGIPLDIPTDVLAIYDTVKAACKEEMESGMSTRWKHAAVLTKLLGTGAKEKAINFAIELAVRELS